jgi:hypothetical protein
VNPVAELEGDTVSLRRERMTIALPSTGCARTDLSGVCKGARHVPLEHGKPKHVAARRWMEVAR